MVIGDAKGRIGYLLTMHELQRGDEGWDILLATQDPCPMAMMRFLLNGWDRIGYLLAFVLHVIASPSTRFLSEERRICRIDTRIPQILPQ